MSVQVTRIDDQDPSITYSSNNWILGGNGNEYMSTTMRTVTLGASMKITFTGTKIAVFGSLGPESIYGQAPTSLFSIDGGRAQQFIRTQAENDSLYQQKFYESANLTPGPHVLLVTISDVPSLTSAFIVDYADITNSGVISSSAVAASSPSTFTPSQTSLPSPSSFATSSANLPSSSTSRSSSTNLISSSSATGSSTGLSSPTPNSGLLIQGTPSSSTNTTIPTFVPQIDTISAQSKNHTPTIVGAIVGCIALILLLLLGVWLYLRRKKAGQVNEKADTVVHEFPMPVPMPVSSPVSTAQSGMWNRTPTEYRPSISYLSSSVEGSTTQSQSQSQAPISKSDEARRAFEVEEDPPSYDALNL